MSEQTETWVDPRVGEYAADEADPIADQAARRRAFETGRDLPPPVSMEQGESIEEMRRRVLGPKAERDAADEEQGADVPPDTPATPQEPDTEQTPDAPDLQPEPEQPAAPTPEPVAPTHADPDVGDHPAGAPEPDLPQPEQPVEPGVPAAEPGVPEGVPPGDPPEEGAEPEEYDGSETGAAADETLFPASMYENPRLRMTDPHGHHVGAISVAVGGTVEMDRLSESDVALVRALHIGSPVTLEVQGTVKQLAYAKDGKGKRTLVVKIAIDGVDEVL